MELKRDAVIFMNLLYRVAQLIGYLNEYEASSSRINKPVLNWNYAVTERVILICVNGLRDDFLDERATPFLADIAESQGAVMTVKVEPMATTEDGLRTIITGNPSHSARFFWNRPSRYATVLDATTCECAIGRLPLKKAPSCYYPEPATEVDVLAKFQQLLFSEDYKECLYVLSYDFPTVSEDAYPLALRLFDDQIRIVAREVDKNWKTAKTTFLLTSARGGSLMKRPYGGVDVPLIAWGHGVLPLRQEEPIRQADVAALVNSLLARSFPSGCTGTVPTFFLNITHDVKFHLVLYNLEFMEKSFSGIDGTAYYDDPDSRSLNGFNNGEDVVNIRRNIAAFVERMDNARRHRMRIATVVIVASLVIWGSFFLVSAVCGVFVLHSRPYLYLFVFATAVYTSIASSQVAILVVLLELVACLAASEYDEIFASFRREGFRTTVISAFVSIFATTFVVLGNSVTLIALTVTVLAWPASGPLLSRVNRKVLALWLVSGILLALLTQFHVIGKTPVPSLASFASVLYLTQHQFILDSFKRSIDLQTWIVTVAVVVSSFHVHILDRNANLNPIESGMSWILLSFALASVPFLRGTLLEHHMKMLLVLLIPVQLLAIRHECVTHLVLTSHMFSWIFMENASTEKNGLGYSPSVFAVSKSSEASFEKLTTRDYRQIAFFVIYCYLSFFASGNVASVYSYDLNVLKSFGNDYSDAEAALLVPLKILIPLFCVVFSFLVLNNLQRRESAPLFMIALHFSDLVSSCILIYTFVIDDIFDFDVSHFVILQVLTIAVTVLYFFSKFLLRSKLGFLSC